MCVLGLAGGLELPAELPGMPLGRELCPARASGEIVGIGMANLGLSK